MVVDRPFLATLRDRKSGAVLFFGRIADPTSISN
jgi:serpin B